VNAIRVRTQVYKLGRAIFYPSNFKGYYSFPGNRLITEWELLRRGATVDYEMLWPAA